jgi:sugar (pentulose or hexulose) kinase
MPCHYHGLLRLYMLHPFTSGGWGSHFTRAIMEAVGFIVRRNIEVIEGPGVSVTDVRALGGARSRAWKQMVADIIGRPVLTTTNEEAATLGAAILAGKAVGLYSSVEEAVERMIQIKERFEPASVNRAIYNETFGTYKKLYDAVCPLFETRQA